MFGGKTAKLLVDHKLYHYSLKIIYLFTTKYMIANQLYTKFELPGQTVRAFTKYKGLQTKFFYNAII